MKHVFSNSSETLHIWAQQSQDSGRCSNVNFSDRTVYSYGPHYPLGHFATNNKGETAVLINASGYSVTTAKHIREAYNAVTHLNTLRIRSTDLMRSLMRNDLAAISLEIVRVIADLTSSLQTESASRRKIATLDKWKNEAALECDNLLSILAWFDAKAKPSIEARKALKLLASDTASLKENAAKARAVEDKRREKLRKAAALANAEFIKQAMPAWLAGIDRIQTPTGLRDTANALHEHSPHILLRVVGEEVQTSRGARFPLAHGLKALPLIRAVVKRGETWKRNGHTIHLGHYQIDSIEHGAIVAGCHTIPISEVERVAASIGA